MLSNKIVLRQTREMDRQRFYQNIRNGAREAKRASQRNKSPLKTVPKENADRLANSGRKTTRFDTSNEDDDLNAQVNPRYDSDETSRLSGDIQIPHQRSLLPDQSFHRTIYSPRTDRRGPSRLPDDRAGVMTPARGTAGVGSRMNNREDTWKSARRDRSGERSVADAKRVDTMVEDGPPPLLVAEESTTNRLLTENKLLKIEMDDVNNQLMMLKSEQDTNIQRINDARKEMERAEREHHSEIETLKNRMRNLEASRAELANEVETQKKKKELIRVENERLRSELERAKGVAEHEQRMAKLREKLEREKERLDEDLDKKTKLVDELTAENSLLKEQCLAAEKDRGFEEELNQMKGKLERKKLKLAGARKDVQELRQNLLSPEQEAELKGKLEKLASALKAKDLLLEEAKKERRDALHEKTDFETKCTDLRDQCKDLKDQLLDLHSQLTSAKKANEQLHDDKKQMECDINRFKNENKKLKEENKVEKENALKLLRFTALEEKIGPMKESIREKDAKIANLEREVDTLRHAVQGYQKQIDGLRHDPTINSRLPPHEASNPINPDHATAHRRLLDENARLLTLLDHYRHLASQPLPSTVEGPRFPVVPSQRSNSELQEAKQQLRSSEERVAQLEKWLDEIYNDKNFDVVMKGRGPSSSLPDLPKRFLLAKGSTDPGKRFKSGFLTDRAQ